MFQVARKQMRTIAMLAVAASLVVAGVATAQSNDSQGGSPNGQAPGRPPGPPPMGLPMKGLTYAELHVQRNGEAQTIRLDQGKVTAVDASSITLTENDGSQVTIPVDDETDVAAKPGEEASLDDIQTGQLVLVCAPDGGTAKSIMVLPKKGELKGPPQGAPMAPPAGGQEDSNG